MNNEHKIAPPENLGSNLHSGIPHTPAPEDWEKEFDEIYLNTHWMELQTSDVLKEKSQPIKSFISRLLTSREAAARREGAERAVEYIKRHADDEIQHKTYPKVWFVMQEVLDAARSEGVNG